MKTAILVIDVQNIYTDEDSELCCEDAESTLSKINSIIAWSEKNKHDIFLVRHINKADGSELGRMYDYLGDEVDEFDFVEGTTSVEYDKRLKRPPGSVEIVKNRYSAFFGTGLQEQLREAGVERVVICGFMTNFCCESTAREAHDRDFFVDFVVDATGTPGTENFEQDRIREIVSEFLEEGFARVLTAEKLLKQ